MKSLHRISAWALAAALQALVFTSCETQIPETLPPDAPISKPSGQLSEGDLIEVSFPGAPDLNLTQKILANGEVNMPIIGDVPAAGKRLGTFQSELERRYRSHLADPRVLVSLETPSAVIYVSGEVQEPGKIPLTRPLTVLEAVMEAGGFSRYANRKQVLVVRQENGRQSRYVRNLDKTLVSGQNKPFYLKPYDTVFVKQSLW